MASKYYYEKELRHNGLNKYRIVKASTYYELEQKCDAILAQWDEQWQRKKAQEARVKDREKKIRDTAKSIKYAAERTREANAVQEAMDTILTESIHPRGFDFESLKSYEKYAVAPPPKPKPLPLPAEPMREDEKYNPQPSFFTRLSKKKMEYLTKENDYQFLLDHKAWEEKKRICKENDQRAQSESRKKIEEWERKRTAYYRAQEEGNREIDAFREAFERRVPSAVERYFSLLLGHIEYPFVFDRAVDVEYSSEERCLIVDLQLPVREDIPKLKAVTYIKSKNEYKEAYYPESYLKKKYDHVIYQMVLQVMNYIFATTDEALIQTTAINGRIRTVDKATGKSIEPYVLSISIHRDVFADINLRAVDPKTWFKSAKGVSAATFADITPVAPLIQMERGDHRFIDAYSVAGEIDESVNLAAMDWQDFENLIREIFEKELNVNGGEVKITQASRDGGVDAVAFDPDPIRGGKIVIQAKRYTNVVGVSAVRDLYGTVLNEGATKGILVTTSNYGNDAYSFAQGKPLTLLNGANLLFLLEKHGHRARIDIKEARRILGLIRE